MLFETGHPWITFKDPCNVRSPQQHVRRGPLQQPVHRDHAQHQPLRPKSRSATSARSTSHTRTSPHGCEGIDHDKLKEDDQRRDAHARQRDRHQLLRLSPEARTRSANLRHRPVGLGVMGVQDALYKRGLPFASDAAVAFNADESMEAVSLLRLQCLSAISPPNVAPTPATRGSCGTAASCRIDSIDPRWPNRARPASSTWTAAARWTGSVAARAHRRARHAQLQLPGHRAHRHHLQHHRRAATPCIEPTYQEPLVKSNLSGRVHRRQQYLVDDLKKRGLWDAVMCDRPAEVLRWLAATPSTACPEDLKALFATAFEIETQVADRSRRPPPEVDRPGPDRSTSS